MRGMVRRRGADVLVLEARDRVDGQFVGPGQERAYALAERLGMKVFATHNDGAVRSGEAAAGQVFRR
ncbi:MULTISPECIES: FAD-dependent oxidoreductase [Actinomadura]|uniref:FAD-dependent oxidoreductase n=1 Tax=Actinomadura yumaensis TaxID=111807 RepID=A0ABW2CII9_9ACTN|nr:FAD-dependent oxidoreductase [Actinomadura sp. J1-007]MWK40646.1 hypothetical protein [Actinomadura sp. J1-007]